MRLYDITDAMRRVFDAIDDADGEVTAEQEAALDALGLTLADKVDAYGHRIRELKAEADALRAEEKRLATRRGSRERQVEIMRERLRQCLGVAEQRKVVTSHYTVSIRPGRMRLVVDDEAQLSSFHVMRPTLDKAAVKDALEAGAELRGAHLEQGDDVITIR